MVSMVCDVREVAAALSQVGERCVAWRVDEEEAWDGELHLRRFEELAAAFLDDVERDDGRPDGLCDGTCFGRDDIAAPDGVEDGRLSVVNVAEDRDDGAA